MGRNQLSGEVLAVFDANDHVMTPCVARGLPGPVDLTLHERAAPTSLKDRAGKETVVLGKIGSDAEGLRAERLKEERHLDARLVWRLRNTTKLNLSENGHPRLANLAKVLDVFGLRIMVAPKAETTVST